LKTAASASAAPRKLPWPLFLRGHGHGRNLGLIAELRQENYSKVVMNTRQSMFVPHSHYSII